MATSPHYIEGCCANCDSPNVTVRAPLFCSPGCRQAAKLVRYVRACRSDGRDQLPDVREAIEMRLAMVLGGGYAERERTVSPDVRAEVFRRAGGLCESCGRPLDFERSTGDPDAIPTIQHVEGNSNDLSNLQAFCRRCNMGDAQSRFVRVEPGSPAAARADELTVRWSSAKPLRLCDDEQRWKGMWQGIARSARDFIKAEEDRDEAWGDEDLPGFEGWTDGGTPIQNI